MTAEGERQEARLIISALRNEAALHSRGKMQAAFSSIKLEEKYLTKILSMKWSSRGWRCCLP